MTYLERVKMALHYLVPQLPLTRTAGWFAQKQWGALTHGVIKLFAWHYNINWQEAEKANPRDYASFNDFFIRKLKADARPIDSRDVAVFPADGRISELGTIERGQLLQAKGHFFSLSDLLAGDESLIPHFEQGQFATVYLSPRDYHRVHMPVSGTLRKMTYVPGELFSVNPFLSENIPNLFARNERVICYFDTDWGPMVQILVGATITASISTTWAGVINPPRTGQLQSWTYPAEGESAVRLEKGQEMGAFRLGSTVITLFAQDAVALLPHLTAGRAVQMGQAMSEARTDNSTTNHKKDTL
ncbi:phosphatidylserine decarboxylase [Pasteurellaceae bacterium HPA106]|uniref:archaetidylserine decarboxylase n=1 Tax=Spirabiliibacterium pneumoniae TaxID=221400 RepID=UPI001AAC5594|nr:archaetidylserine decarboxylase [Spirabiliibacterium pneumoniae]MBE2895847.1 phosphatidylserine decarboxylase [Spirabiliibacterium pneumoniae]